MPRLILTVFLPFALAPVVSFLLRIVNAVIAPDLVAELDLNPANLGLLTSVYFLGFGAAQLPLGLMLDRYGPRRVAATLYMLGATGAVIYALGPNAATLTLGRGLMGIGMSCSVMAGLKAASIWFPSQRLPLINMTLFGMSGVGGMLATVPLAWLLEHIDWRVAVFGMGALAAALAITFFTVVPEKREAALLRPSLTTQIRELGTIYRSPVFWWITPLAMISTAGFASYLSLWIGLWSRDVAGADRAGQALHLFAALAGMLVGNVLFGLISQVKSRWQVTPVRLAVAGIVLFIGVQALMVLEVTTISLPLAGAFGVFSSGALMLYTMQSQAFPPALSGRAVTAMNVLIFATSFSFQWGVGVVIHQFPVGADGRYDPVGHQLALVIIIGLEIAALAWFFWRRHVVRS